MKRFRIILFIFAIIAVLGAISFFFPEGGVSLGKINLEFLTIEELLASEEDESRTSGPSPEDIITLRKEAIRNAEKDSLMSFFGQDPARFYLPEGNLEFFDNLFTALDNADSIPVRIVHYGDSQLEEDRITAVIRDSLQKKFGGSGQGMMPARKHFTPKVASSSSPELSRYMAYGNGNRTGNGLYGPFGDFVRLRGNASLSFRPWNRKDNAPLHFNEVTLVAGNLTGSLRVRYGDSTQTFPSGASLVRAVFEVPDSSSKVSLSVSGSADIYGVLMDDKKGVSVDNIPMRGCSGTMFTSIRGNQMKEYYEQENVKLILMQYGGNIVPYIKSPGKISTYCSTIRKQINHIQEQAPGTAIVFIGPSDMSTVIKGKRQTYPHLPQVVDSLRAAANDAGAAYWDIYGAMGGKNSMVNWVKARPALAGSDYIHFTTRGSQHIGSIFYESLRLYYDYYIWRKDNE